MTVQRFAYEFYKDRRVVRILAPNLYEAEVIFSEFHGEWPRPVGAVMKSPRAHHAKYRFETREGRPVFITMRMAGLNRAEQAFEDRFGYRPQGGRLV